MALLFENHLPLFLQILLWGSLGLALVFEFINGFHDTANAVATVIYTKTLKPTLAVILSSCANFCGVFLGGLGVAIGIINLLPSELTQGIDPLIGLSMVISLLLGATLWNLGTWYFGIPASSSHTLIGSIVGVGLGNSLLPGHAFGDGVNWGSLGAILLSLVVSPFFGFVFSFLLLKLARRVVSKPDFFVAPKGDTPPPLPIRILLIFTCLGVSTAHGSNDGQKGVGLILLILTLILPVQMAGMITETQIDVVISALKDIPREECNAAQDKDFNLLECESYRIFNRELSELTNLLSENKKLDLKTTALIRQNLKSLDETYLHVALVSRQNGVKYLGWESQTRKKIQQLLYPLPKWVLFAVALALGFGTMFGWKRIVVTVGEKIGQSHLTYAQGAIAELVAASTIGLAAASGLPVSTTHVLSSGVAGSMIAEGSGIQSATVNKIVLAWVLTLPATMFISGGLYLIVRLFI